MHTKQIARLNRIEGQIRGIKKMIEDQRNCIDIISQCSAAGSALNEVKKNILREHLNHCVMESIRTNDPEKALESIQEIINLIGLLSK